MKKNIYLVLVFAVLAVVFLVTSAQSVKADAIPAFFGTPAAGSWTWDNELVTGVIIPQYQLAPTYDPDYALLQSEGIYLSGGTQLCHPYPGGQFGWTAEIRVLTSQGWQSVPTLNQWVPDKEGKFMTCANVWYSGTYAVFGYWEKPDGWGIVDHSCADLFAFYEWEYVGPAATFPWSTFLSPGESNYSNVGTRCAIPFVDFSTSSTDLYWESEDGTAAAVVMLSKYGYSCACENIYKFVNPIIIGIE